MTGITLFAGGNVAAGFIRLTGRNSAIVTALANAERFVVIDHGDRSPGRHRVTSGTNIAGQYMCGGFIAGDDTVMAGLANTDGGDFVMVDGTNRCPCGTGVAGLADIGRINVRGRFAAGRGAVVTGNAGVRRGAVIEGRHCPVNRGVTNLASLGGRYVCG